MSFDIENALEEMLRAMMPILHDEWSDIKDYLADQLEEKKTILKELAELRIKGDLTEDALKNEILRETLVLEANLQARLVNLKAFAQEALNTAVKVLLKLIKEAL